MAQLSVKAIKDRIATAEKRLAMRRGASGISIFVWDVSSDGGVTRNETLFQGSVAVVGAKVMNLIAVPRGRFLAPDTIVSAPASDDGQMTIFGLLDALDASTKPEIAQPVAHGEVQMTLFEVGPPVIPPAPAVRIPRLMDAPDLIYAPVPKLTVKNSTGEAIMPEKEREPTFMDDPVKRDEFLSKMAEEFADEKIEERRAARDAARGVRAVTAADIEEMQQAMSGTAASESNPVVRMAHNRAVMPDKTATTLPPAATVISAMPSPFG